MAKQILTSLNLNKNEIQNVVIHKVATLPQNPVKGQLVFLTTDNELYVYDGTAWEIVGADNIDWSKVTNTPTTISGYGITDAVNVADIINNVASTATNKPLSANMGKELSDRITNVESRGRYLSLWNCVTGLAGTNPPVSPYTYKTGDYYIIGTVASGSGTNYRPNGSTYTIDVPSTTAETETVKVNDTYIYDGTVWKLQENAQREVTFASITGDPMSNTELAADLDAKADDSDLTAHTEDTSNPHSVTKTQVGLGNVDNKSETTIKSDFTGAITSENTGFPTGGAVYAALQGLSKVNSATGIISTIQTSCEVSYSGTYIGTVITDADGEEVLCDVTVASNKVTVVVAQAPSSALTVKVTYFA